MSALEASNIIKHFVADRSLGRVQSYLERGRRFRGKTELQLRRLFLSSTMRLADDLDDTKAALTSDDSQSEYELRKMEPPYALVELEIKLITMNTAIRLMAMPEHHREVGAEILESYQSSQAKRN